MRPFHDLRHTAITNAAAAGVQATELMAWAGHSDFATTKRYIDLAGETFRNVSKRLSERVWGETGKTSGTKTAIRRLTWRQKPPLCTAKGSRVIN